MAVQMAYTIEEWRDSVEQAVNAGFDRQDEIMRQWPLSDWISDIGEGAYGYILKHFPDVEPAELLEAVGNVLDDHYEGSVAKEFFLQVLTSYKGSTTDDFHALCREYLVEEQGIAEPFVDATLDGLLKDTHDYDDWYIDNVARDGETYGTPAAGGTAYWFDMNKW